MPPTSDIPATHACVLLRAPGITVHDTARMAWGKTDYMPAALAKVVSRDPKGEPTISIRSYPEGRTKRSEPVGSYHLDRELYFILGGESPHWEFDPAEREVVRTELARLLTLREGYWLDRAPMSPHGGGAPRPSVALLSLSFTVGGDDPFVGEYECLGAAVPSALSRGRTQAGVVHADPLVRVTRTREMAWEPLPSRHGAMIKTLSCREDGDPTVTLRWVHAAGSELGGPAVASGVRFREFVYVIDGELRLSTGDHPGVRVPAGGFVEAASHAAWVATSQYPDAPGATVLHWRLREGSMLLTDAEKETRTRYLANRTGSADNERYVHTVRNER